jgi:hypothetical protein
MAEYTQQIFNALGLEMPESEKDQHDALWERGLIASYGWYGPKSQYPYAEMRVRAELYPSKEDVQALLKLRHETQNNVGIVGEHLWVYLLQSQDEPGILLSEAIRKQEGKRQCYKEFIHRCMDGQFAFCAFGAAYLTISSSFMEVFLQGETREGVADIQYAITHRWPFLGKESCWEMPDASVFSGTLYSVIVMLNDNHMLTFTEMANWLKERGY